VERGENVLAFGLPGRGKSHFVAALSRELILRRGHTVLFIPTFKLVQSAKTVARQTGFKTGSPTQKNSAAIQSLPLMTSGMSSRIGRKWKCCSRS